MNKRIAKNAYLTLMILVLFGVLVLVVSSCNGGSNAVKICREQAPEDPYVDDAEGSEMIYSMCQKASKSLPNDAEIAYLFGTSALEADHPDDAIAAFRRAEILGYCSKACYFIGDYYLHFENDEAEAETYFLKAADAGDPRAADEVLLPEFFEKLSEPELFKALYNSDLKILNKVRFRNATYFLGLYDLTTQQFNGQKMKPCFAGNMFPGTEVGNQLRSAERGDASTIFDGYLYEITLPVAFAVIYSDQGTDALKLRRDSLKEGGSVDGIRFFSATNENCSSLAGRKIKRGLELFAKSKKSLFETMKELKPQISSLDDLRESITNNGQLDKN